MVTINIKENINLKHSAVNIELLRKYLAPRFDPVCALPSYSLTNLKTSNLGITSKSSLTPPHC